MMTSAHRPSSSVTSTSVRIPKLAVRNRSPEDASEPTGDHAARPPLSSTSSGSSERTILLRRESDQSQSSQDSGGRSRQNKSSNGLSDAQTANTKVKRKKSGLLGFLTLKEPSTSAWEQYAETQKQAATQKTGRTTAVGLPGVSSRKLPESVPPTNSKWDGLPENASKRFSAGSLRSSGRPSLSISASKPPSRRGYSSHSIESRETTIRKFGSMTSKPPKTSGRPKPPSIASTVSSGDARRPVVYHAAAPTGVHPALRDNAVTPWDEPSEALENPSLNRSPEEKIMADEATQTFLHPPSPPLCLPEPVHPVPDHDIPDLPHLDEMPGNNTSPEPMPRTPRDEHFASVIRVSDGEHSVEQPAELDGHNTCWLSDTENDTEAEQMTASSGRARSPPNFSRPWRRSVLSPVLPPSPMLAEGSRGIEEVLLNPAFRVQNERLREMPLEVTFAEVEGDYMPTELPGESEGGRVQYDSPLELFDEEEEEEDRQDMLSEPTSEYEDEYTPDVLLEHQQDLLLEHQQDLPLEHHQNLPLEPDFQEEDEDEEDETDEDEDFLPSLRDARGHTSPFLFDQHRKAFQSPALEVARQYSASASRLTNQTTATAPRHSPAFTYEPAASTRPTTAASTETAHMRSRSLSPSRSISDTASIAHSVAPSMAPSVMSVQWNMTPKERLGLGGRVIKRAGVPWEVDEGLSRRSSTTQTSSREEGSKLKRLSMALGMK